MRRPRGVNAPAVLRRAADLVEQHGLARRCFDPQAGGGVCVIGAVNRAAGAEPHVRARHQPRSAVMALSMLRCRVLDPYDLGGLTRGLAAWGDQLAAAADGARSAAVEMRAAADRSVWCVLCGEAHAGARPAGSARADITQPASSGRVWS